jgi:hypothetical protein
VVSARARGFYTLDRYIDRYLKGGDDYDFGRAPRDPTTNQIDPVIDTEFPPYIEVLFNMLSGFTADDLNMEFYLQLK